MVAVRFGSGLFYTYCVQSSATPGRLELALQRAFPALAGRLPRAALTQLPTRVHRLSGLERHAGGGEIWIKRDDESGALYGGNKPRKLEFLLGDALADCKHAVLTFGGLGTHHGLATAIYARTLGLRTILLLVRQPVTEAVRRSLLLDLAAGAELHYGASVAQLTARGLRVCAREWLNGELPYIIPTGGSSPLGTLGYVNAAFELREQVRAGALPEPAWIVVPIGSGGTHAGLVLGLKLAGLATRVAGVLVTDIVPPSEGRLVRLANRTAALLRQHDAGVPTVQITPADIRIIRGFLGAGYGAPTDDGARARNLVSELEGVMLDTTYTAKAMAGLLATLHSGELPGPVLFWNTYSSIDPASHLGPLPDWRSLPRRFHRFFAGNAAAAG